MKIFRATRTASITALFLGPALVLQAAPAPADLCAGFVIHTPGNTTTTMLLEGMNICPLDFPHWNVEALCTPSASQVIIKLYDNTDKVVVRRGNDKTPADGWYWNKKPTTFTNSSKELVEGKQYCFYALVDGSNMEAVKVCFNVYCNGCGDYDWTCGSIIEHCNHGNSHCICDVDTDGAPFCWNNILCSQTTSSSCASNAHCPNGWRCASSCCGLACLPECGSTAPPPPPIRHLGAAPTTECFVTATGMVCPHNP